MLLAGGADMKENLATLFSNYYSGRLLRYSYTGLEHFVYKKACFHWLNFNKELKYALCTVACDLSCALLLLTTVSFAIKGH